MGPNEGKSFLEQTQCVARAIMSYSPQYFDKIVEHEKILVEFFTQHGDPKNVWHRFIHSWGNWYIYYSKDPITEGGRSTSELPNGVKIAATFDMRSNEREYATKFEKAVTLLESGFTQTSFLNLVNETIDSPILLNDLRTDFANVIDDYFKEQIQNLRKTVDACEPEYNINKILEFRNWLRKFPDTTIPDKPSLLLVNDPNRLKSFVEHLQEERRRYCADAILVGSIQTIYDICRLCASEVYKKSSSNKNLEAQACFSNLALVLAINKEVEPLQILSDTVQKGINMGFINELLTVLSKYHSIVDEKIKEARSSETVDQSLDHLYSAIPFALGARTVLFILSKNADILDESRKLQVSRSYRNMDETLVRFLTRPFLYQVADFEGKRWNLIKSNIASIKRTRGEKTAKIYVEDLVLRHLIFPESIIPKLLDENN
jgi:hypothetical protein